MPGVPSSRGCEACRQQKKKCDQQTPTCSRCARLGISCIGSGERRYKFMAVPERKAQRSTGSGACAEPKFSATGTGMQQLTVSSRAPSNQTTLDVSRLVSALQVTDVRFYLRIYGRFFPELPRRLGRNPALDASARALATAFPSVHTHQYTPDMYKTYGDALASLRAALTDPAMAGSADTLCAVYLVVICQGWIGRGGDFLPSHGEAIVHMLNTAAAARTWQGEFEAELTNTLLVTVLLESFVNPKIKLDPRLWAPSDSPPVPRLARPSETQAIGIECLKPSNLAAMSSYTHNVHENLPAVQSASEVVRSDLAKMRAILDQMSQEGFTAMTRAIHARRLTAYGTLLLLGLMANWALSAFGIGDPSTLEAEKAHLVDEVVGLAEVASQYRPLAASAMPRFILMAKAMTNDAAKLTRLEELLVLYQSDFPAGRQMKG